MVLFGRKIGGSGSTEKTVLDGTEKVPSQSNKWFYVSKIKDYVLGFIFSFKTIAVSGQSSVVADSDTDTLTLVAGTNVTITTNASTDTITINSSASGTGDFVGPGSATDNAVVRFDSTTGKLGQNSLMTVDDSGSSNIPTGQTYKINGSAHTHSYAPNAFSTIAVSGQSDVVADSITDTMTLVAGANITLTTDASTDTITIAASGGGGGGGAGAIAIFDHHADAGNTGTGEDDLYGDTIAAGQLATNDDKIFAEYGGVFVSSGTATREIKAYFGGTMIFDTGTLTLSLSSAWTLYLMLIRVSSSVIRYEVSFATEGAALGAYTSAGEVTGLTLSGTNVLKLTGEAAGVGAATNDIVAKLGTVWYFPVAGSDGVVDDTPYDATTWNGDTTHAPSKNAVRDKIESLSGGGRTLISSQSLAGVTSVTFSSIPGTYAKLTLEFVARSTSTSGGVNAVDAYLQFNADTTAANYLFELIRENQSGRASEFGANYKIASATIPNGNAPANEFGIGEIDIVDYANSVTTKKAHQHLESVYDAVTIFMQIQSGGLSWANTAAITAIVFALSAGNGAANSVVNLYGE